MVTLPLRIRPPTGCCPYCLEPVGILGNWIAKLMGTRFHGCGFGNVDWDAATHAETNQREDA
jgi:hypothetical protein